MLKKKKIDWKQRLLPVAAVCLVAGIGPFIYMFFNYVTAVDNKTIRFPSEDGLTITADTYLPHDAESTPLILMFHQANWSRGEYLETAPRFNALGYNCLVVDLRSGNKVLGVANETYRLALETGKETRFVDAMQDVKAALSFARQKYKASRVIAMGSSYSAGLVLKVAGDYPHLVDGVIAFSPGEYFVKEGKPHDWIEKSVAQIAIPVFIASARKEKHRWLEIYKSINTETKMSYIPVSTGQHGSRALWERFPDSEGYWRVVKTFLKSFF